jgi:hydrogenase expression/formation protein HypC
MCLALPGRVESVRDEAGIRMGRMDFGGVVREICLACLPDLAPGDYALVHAGFAIARIDEAAAEATLDVLATLDSPAAGDSHASADAAAPGSCGRREVDR